MPKFEKGSLEMKNYMAELRNKKGTNNRPMSTHKHISKEHIQIILNEALEKYYLVSTPVVEVPEKLVTIKDGKAKLIDTLTKSGNLKKIDGKNVINLETGDNLNVKLVGTKYNRDQILKTIPSQTIVHKVEQKTSRPQILATTKDYNDVIDFENDNIPIQRINNNPQTKTTRRPSILSTTKDYNDVIDFKNDNIPIQRIIHNPQSKPIRITTQEPYTDLYEGKTINIEPEMHKTILHKTEAKKTEVKKLRLKKSKQ